MPLCSPIHTSANPPLYSGSSDRSQQSGICRDFGRRAWRLHILCKMRRHFCRSGGSKLSNIYPARRSPDMSHWPHPRQETKYLLYHINKSLGFISAKTLGRLSFVNIGEDVCDQGDPHVRCGRRSDQTFPCRIPAICLREVRSN